MEGWYNQLHVGDCIKELERLDPASVQVDLVFADPPYNIGYKYDVYHDRLDDEAYLAWTATWLKAVVRVLKPTGTLWLAIGDEYAAEAKVAAQAAGLWLRSWVIWYYTFGVNCTRKFSRSHTHLLYFVKDPERFTFDDAAIRVPSARKLVYNDARADRRGRLPDNTWILRPQDAAGGFLPEHDTWYFPRVAGTFKERAGFHGCQMPEQLLGRIIRCCSQPGEVVLDPFAGSASTLVVARKLGRRWVGYELSPQYARHARARLAAVRPGDPLEGFEDPLSSAPATPRGRAPRCKRVDERGIVAAFQRAAAGHASDRVLADPVLNAAFIEECSARGLAGRPADWNLALLDLRKAGRLASIPATKRTTFTWDDLEPFLFASEIALRRMLDLGYSSLDHVLCDPLAAARFDQFARSLAPGFTSLQYRWAALRLRKDAKLWRQCARNLSQRLLPKKPRTIPLDEAGIARLRDAPAVYLLSMAGELPRKLQPVYVGQTSHLVDRARRTLQATPALDEILLNTGQWQLGLFELANLDQTRRRGLQSLLIARHQPKMNYLELGRTHARAPAAESAR